MVLAVSKSKKPCPLINYNKLTLSLSVPHQKIYYTIIESGFKFNNK